MSDVGVTSVIAAGRPGTDFPHLREKVNEFVGLAFYLPLLNSAQTGSLQGKYGHGGRGEEMFRSQLNLELARRAGQAGRLGVDEAIYRRLAAAYERGGPGRD